MSLLSAQDSHLLNSWSKKECSNIKLLRSVHWLAMWLAKSLKGFWEFQHPAEIKPVSPDWFRQVLLASTNDHEVVSIYQKKWSTKKWYITQIYWLHWSNKNRFFACRTFIGLFKLNLKARQDIPEFLTLNLWHSCIWLQLELNYFLFTHFSLNAQWHGSDYWSVTQQMID